MRYASTNRVTLGSVEWGIVLAVVLVAAILLALRGMLAAGVLSNSWERRARAATIFEGDFGTGLRVAAALNAAAIPYELHPSDGAKVVVQVMPKLKNAAEATLHAKGVDPRLLSQLHDALRRLGVEPAEQVAYLRQLGTYPSADELALEWHNDFLWLVGSDNKRFLTDDQLRSLVALDTLLNEMSGAHNATLWDADSLATTNEWRRVRAQAREALTAMEPLWSSPEVSSEGEAD